MQIKEVFLATNNAGKIERYKHLIEATGLNVKVFTSTDLNLEQIEVIENGKTLAENAELKAKAYRDKVHMPILANDTGFYVEGEGFIDAPKRIALGGSNEQEMTKEEIAEKLINFWKAIATKYGGKVDAAWIDSFVLIDTNGKMESAEARREVILTDQEFGNAHIQMPVRALYISKTTNKPSILHTKEEEILEMEPLINALRKILIN